MQAPLVADPGLSSTSMLSTLEDANEWPVASMQSMISQRSTRTSDFAESDLRVLLACSRIAEALPSCFTTVVCVDAIG